MILGFSDPLSRWIVFAVLLAVGAGVLALLWLAFRAVCRRLGVQQRTQAAIAIGFVLLLCGAAFALLRDRLDDLEQSCERAFLASTRAADASEMEIRKHVNLWKGWSSMWGYTEPFVDPKVMLWLRFAQGGRKHNWLVTCHFNKAPGPAEKAQLRFERLEIMENSVP